MEENPTWVAPCVDVYEDKGAGTQEGPWMWLRAAEKGTVTTELKGSSSEGTAIGNNSLAAPQTVTHRVSYQMIQQIHS